jgi:hypothetical protein
MLHSMPVPVMMPSLIAACGSPKKNKRFVDQNQGIDPALLASGKLAALLGACEQSVPKSVSTYTGQADPILPGQLFSMTVCN